jgi:hypothetical protein
MTEAELPRTDHVFEWYRRSMAAIFRARPAPVLARPGWEPPDRGSRMIRARVAQDWAGMLAARDLTADNHPHQP